ncbi:MAG: hypothetical protein HYW52_06300 [Gemmatimonadetes bacterium]|nr:hypothetical protein [Gemmatimonadota bacterium]
MARGFSKATSAIQRLLDERQQIQTWLQRLAMASDTTPEQVRTRVRADYERRLGEVMKELQTHESELHTTMDRLEGARAGLARQETEAAERLAEAELRHAVGEYDESQWRQVHADLLGALVKVREELKQSDDEIRRLEEVMSLIEVQPAPAAPPPARPAGPARKEPRKEAADELAFLRSVSEDESQGPAPSRASGAMRAIQEPAPAASSSGREYADPEAKKGATPRSSKATKSLKCKECGTMNLPTEWYCERCGAELAAL